MSRCVRQLPAANRDIIEITDFLADQSLDVAIRFVDQLEAECLRLLEMPGIGGIYLGANDETSGLRVWRVKGFSKYLDLLS